MDAVGGVDADAAVALDCSEDAGVDASDGGATHALDTLAGDMPVATTPDGGDDVAPADSALDLDDAYPDDTPSAEVSADDVTSDDADSASPPTDALDDADGPDIAPAETLEPPEPATLDLPFAYAIEPSALRIHTPGGDVFASLGPWGSHFSPNTGHAYGDRKSNINAFFTADLDGLTAPDGSPCEPGRFCELPESLLQTHLPTYLAPADGRIIQIDYGGEDPSPFYFPNNRHIRVRFLMAGFLLDYGHMGRVSPLVRARALESTCQAGTCVDLDAWPSSAQFSSINVDIAIKAGEAIGHPQVVAVPSSNPGYFVGAGTNRVPWIQIEFFLNSLSAAEVCLYDLLPPATKAALQAVLDSDMASATSQRYGASYLQPRKWQWAAEGSICMASGVPRGSETDFTSLHAALGGWWRVPQAGAEADELLAFARVAKEAASYDAGRYTSPVVDHLVLRTRRNRSGMTFDLDVPGAGVIHANPLVGEVLEETGGALFVRWRDVPMVGDLYQRGAYLLDANGLKLRWGAIATTADLATPATLESSDPCDVSGVLCFDHRYAPGF